MTMLGNSSSKPSRYGNAGRSLPPIDMNPKIRILVAEDHLVARVGVSAIINCQTDMVVVAEAVNGQQAVETVSKTLARHHTSGHADADHVRVGGGHKNPSGVS